jgi:3',5'-cyclic AMP phosphodiesterase CpdA
MKLGPRSLRRFAVVVAAATLGGCLPLTRAPQYVPPLDVPFGSTQVYAVGDLADCRRDPPDRAAARDVAGLVPDGATVLALGDLVYPLTDPAALAQCYEPTWGRHRASTLAVAGNHDYVADSSRTFRAYFNLDALATSDRYIAYTRAIAPDWLLIVLDSNVDERALRDQLEWLRQTLERERPRAPGASPAPAPRCLAVAWHAPLYSSGWHRGSGEHMRPYWELLDAYGADLVLSGHEHFYEAFAPFDAYGRRVADGEGPRQFTVGTGGARLYGFWKPPYASRSRVLEYGVLQLTLAPGRYAWRFIDLERKVRDAGSADCRGPAQDARVPATVDLG